jgi:hypothetical protein
VTPSVVRAVWQRNGLTNRAKSLTNEIDHVKRNRALSRVSVRVILNLVSS